MLPLIFFWQRLNWLVFAWSAQLFSQFSVQAQKEGELINGTTCLIKKSRKHFLSG